MKFRVEGDHESESYFDPVEKVYNIPLYVVRKLIFYMCMSSINSIAFLSSLFGFRFDYEFSDKPRWNWMTGFKLPRYGVVKKD